MKPSFKSTTSLRFPSESPRPWRGWRVAILTTGLLAPPAAAQTTAFTYQGKLTDGGAPAAGLHDFEFKLHAENGGDAQVGDTVSVEDVNVTGGLFTVALDFGGEVFDGRYRWLEIAVRPGASTGAYTTLDPRQPVTSTPYAVKALEAAQLPAGAVTGAMLADGAVTAAKIAPGAVSQLGAPGGSPANAVQVNANGLVGVGTNAPAAGLHITAGQSFLNAEQLAVRVDESGGYTRLAGANAVAVQGNLAAVTGSADSGVTLLDVSNPENPAFRSQFRDGDGTFTQLDRALCVAMKPNVLAVGAFSDAAVTLIDVSNPASPAKLAELKDGIDGWNELDGAVSVAIGGNLMAVAAFYDSAVTLVDITNAAAPVKRAELKDGAADFDFLQGAISVAFSGAPANLLAIAAYYDDAVTLVDVTDPANPVKRAELRDGAGGFNYLSGLGDLEFSGNLLAIASSSESAVTLVDVTDPASPVKLSELKDGVDADSLGGAAGLSFSGNQLAVAAVDDDAVTVFDVSDRVNPAVLAVARHEAREFTHLDRPSGVAFAGSSLLVAAQTSGALTTMRLATRSAGLSSEAWVGIGTTRPAGALHVLGDVFVEQSDNVQISTARFAAGKDSVAIGDFASALGFASKAIGPNSTAIGNYTFAVGDSSTAMGSSTIALGDYSTATGFNSVASGDYSTAMGSGTLASGTRSTSLGDVTIASGLGSTALGSYARALHDGTFVWSDRSAVDFESTVANQFAIRASGGFYLDGRLGVGTSAPDYPLEVRAALAVGRFTTTGNPNGAVLSLRNTSPAPAYLGAINFEDGGGTPGQIAYLGGDEMSFRVGGVPSMVLNDTGLSVNGTFVSVSDRNAKENFSPADVGAVLEKVATLPISEWNYKTDTGTRHIGPMAQDFHAAFKVGPDDQHIATVDADGVALAAIQGLNEKLEAEIGAKDARIAALEKRLAAIEALLKK